MGKWQIDLINLIYRFNFYDSHFTIRKGGHIYSRFPSNSEAFAAELLENTEEMFSMSEFSATH